VASLPFSNAGPTVQVVTVGTIVVESDQAVISTTDIAIIAGLQPMVASQESVDQREVHAGQQIFLPEGSTTTIRNESAAKATVLIVAVVPIPTGTPAPNPPPGHLRLVSVVGMIRAVSREQCQDKGERR
jgi:hypothetical protein